MMAQPGYWSCLCCGNLYKIDGSEAGLYEADHVEGQKGMTKFVFEVSQRFDCTYVVEAPTQEEAWARLLDGQWDECNDQVPEELLLERGTDSSTYLVEG